MVGRKKKQRKEKGPKRGDWSPPSKPRLSFNQPLPKPAFIPSPDFTLSALISTGSAPSSLSGSLRGELRPDERPPEPGTSTFVKEAVLGSGAIYLSWTTPRMQVFFIDL
jgi:hypothetical protein